MKKIIYTGLICTLAFILLFAFGCNGEKEYKLQEGTQVVTVSSQGFDYSLGLSFNFDGEYKGFAVDAVPYNDIHDSANCNKCGIVDVDGTKAFLLQASGYSGAGAGLLIKMEQPMLASVFSGITMTFRASADKTDNELRVTRGDATSRSETKNDSPDLSGAKDDWKTVNLDLSSVGALADEDGYLRSFVIFMRNYDNTDIYIRNITLKANLEEACSVDINVTESLYEKGAVTSIANSIADKLTDAGIAAEVSVTCEEYKQNTLSQDGAITYYIDLNFASGSYFTESITKTIPALSETWLTEGSKEYGYTMKDEGDIDTSSLSSGMLTIADTKVKCNEKLKGAQYAVYAEGISYTDESIEWKEAQQADTKSNKVKKIFVNAFLDYADSLVAGTKYNIAVRLVTKDDNYIPVCEKQFTYNVDNSTVGEAMIAAKNAIAAATVECGNGDDKEARVKEALEGIVANSDISIEVKLKTKSMAASSFDIIITSTKDENFAHKGESFVIENFVSWHDVKNLDNVLVPQTPYDGTEGIVLAQDFILTHFTNSYSAIRSAGYEFYSPLEICTPPAISFTWTDKNDTGKYTVTVADNPEFENSYSYSTKTTSIDLYNFQPGVKYYWKVATEDSESVVFTFSIATGYTRFLKIDGVQNVRDLGGYKTANGQAVKYGLLYRSANLDSVKSQGIKEFVDRLGVKTDLDFRGDNGNSPLGKDVNYLDYAIKWYSGIFADEEKLDLIRQTIGEYANPENYPMCFHCAVGRDRTGTMSFLILGLLGVDEETLVREYFLSMYSAMGSFSESEFNALSDQLFPFISKLHTYGESDDTLQVKIEKFMLGIGVTQDEINSIRSIMLEGEPSSGKNEAGCASSASVAHIMFVMAAFVVLKKKSTCK